MHGSTPVPSQASTWSPLKYPRSAKTVIKKALQRFGVLGAVRSLLRAADRTYTMRLSPTRDWGEQLVVVARRRPDGDAGRRATTSGSG